jgi:hypothetical protein
MAGVLCHWKNESEQLVIPVAEKQDRQKLFVSAGSGLQF